MKRFFILILFFPVSSFSMNNDIYNSFSLFSDIDKGVTLETILSKIASLNSDVEFSRATCWWDFTFV